MTRHDWLFVILRSYGVYLLVGAGLAAPTILGLFNTRLDGGLVWHRLEQIIFLAVQFGLGWLLAVRTNAVLDRLAVRDSDPAAADKRSTTAE